MIEERNHHPFHQCLNILLKALKWHGDKRQLAESLPHFSNILTIEIFCDVMRNLRYKYETLKIEINSLDPRFIPCLFITKNGKPFVIFEQTHQGVAAYDGIKNTNRILNKNIKGTIYFFQSLKNIKSQSKPEISFFRNLFHANKKLIYHSCFISFFLNLLAIATPLFIMAVYNKVIGSDSLGTLKNLLVGVGIALLGALWLHKIRSYMLSLFGTRIDHDIGNAILERLLYLSPSFTETATVGAQVARIKDFQNVREFLAGPIITVLFDLPFILIFLIIIAIIGGNLVYVPIIMTSAFVILFLIMHERTKQQIKNATRSNTIQQEYLLETLHNMQTIKQTSIEKIWQQRYREISATNSIANLKATVTNAINNAISDTLMIGAGMAILVAGVLKVFNATLTIGGLIAVMILVWRLLAPIKTLFITLPKLNQINTSLKQIHHLLRIKPEMDPQVHAPTVRCEFKGAVRVDRVSFRYPNTMTPTLLGISFTVSPGQLVAIIGRNGSGKSTLLKLLLAMYQPQAGKIIIDDTDIRQLNPIELRQAVNYVPQNAQFFYGTVAQNLYLADPTATDNMLVAATKQADIYDEIQKMPEGFNTRLKDRSSENLASSFQQRLNLARAYLKQSAILLLDEPAIALDASANTHFINTLASLKGKKTIFMVTHRPSHLKSADKILLLEQGQLILNGPPDTVLPKITSEAF